MTTEVEVATKTLNDLMDQRDQLIGRSARLVADRQAVAYVAHTGDKGAKERLRKINDETVLHNAELEGIDAAIVEANARLAATKQAEASAADRVNAQQLKQAAARLVELGAIIDDCFADIISASTELREVINKIHGLGSNAPTHDQVRVLGALAMKTALMGTPWAKEFEHLAPGSRRSFAATCNGWSEMLAGNIAARLGETNVEVAA